MARRRNPGDDEPDLRPVLNAFLALDPRSQLILLVIVAVVGLIALLVYEHRRPSAAPQTVADANLLLGNPSSASADTSNRDNYLMVKPYFTLSYNSDNGTPNWVSWRVALSDLGDAPRKQLFDPDSSLPPGFTVVTHKDYSGSGFDRGHMCPHSDRAANTDMSFATFVMTNIIPQAPNVNRKAWEQLESYCRDLVRRDHDRLYVVAGPAGRGGRGANGPRNVIGHGKVAVPAQCWKIVVVVPDSGADDPSRIDAGSRVIAVMMPNDNEAVGDEWAGFRTSAASVESQTGLHFFSSLSPDVAQALRQKVDAERIPPPRPHGGGGED